MPDWSQSMQQTFEYYIVNPITWKDEQLLTKVKSCTITWDLEADTLGSASMDIDEDIGEKYIRIYLITTQNGVIEKHPLGTFLVQTLPTSFNGKNRTISVDAYTPLLELNEKYPPLGYYIPKNNNIMFHAYKLAKENMRGPVMSIISEKTLYEDFVADTDDTYLSLIKDLITNAKHEYRLDEMGRLFFVPTKKIEALQPIWTYTDDNSSILYPDIDSDRDLYGIPNVVEVFASTGSNLIYSIKENNDIDSPTSIKNRGRRIIYRETDPKLNGIPSVTNDEDPKKAKKPAQDYLDEYAEELLKKLSSLEYTISYQHAYCPVRIGDCIRITSSIPGLENIKAKVISQTIKCVPGCPVSEKAIFTSKLWR